MLIWQHFKFFFYVNLFNNTVNENFAGLLNFLLPILAAIPLVGFLIQTDVPGLSFIQVCSFLCLHTV